MVWKRTALTIGALALLILPSVAGAQAQPQAPAQGKSLSLSLDDCIVRALKSNLAIQVAEFGPQLSEISLADAKSQYLPTMTPALHARPQRERLVFLARHDGHDHDPADQPATTAR